MTELLQQPHPTFAHYVSALAQAAMDSAEEKRLLMPEDDRFFQALNRYLAAENAPLVDETAYAGLPVDFARQMHAGLDIGALNQTDNVFNEGADFAARVRSPQRTMALAALYESLAVYMQANNEAVQVGRGLSVAGDSDEARHTKVQLWRRDIRKTADGRTISELVPADQIDWSKKPVVCMGGIGSMAMNPAELNGLMKQAEQLLGGMEMYEKMQGKDVQLYCLSYPLQYRARMNAQVLSFNADPDQYVIPFMRQAYAQYWQPVVAAMLEQSEGDISAGLRSALRKWNFFTTSYGSVCVKSLSTLLAEDLLSYGMKPEQIKPLLAEVFALNANPVNRLDDTKACGNFSAIHLVSRNDRTVRSRANHQEHYPSDDHAEHIIPVSENELLLWSDHPRSGLLIEPLPRDELSPDNPANIRGTTQLQGRRIDDATGHHVQLTTGRLLHREGEHLAQMYIPVHAQHALRHAVIETEMPAIDHMLSPVKLYRYPREMGTVNERLLSQREMEEERTRHANSNKPVR